MQNELLKQGINVDKFDEKRPSVQTIYEIQTIKVDAKGDRSLSKKLSVDQEPQEVSDLNHSLNMLNLIKRNS